MTPITMTQGMWESEWMLEGFPMAEINKYLDAKLQCHDTKQDLLIVSYPTKSEFTNPAGVVNGRITSTMSDITTVPIVVGREINRPAILGGLRAVRA